MLGDAILDLPDMIDHMPDHSADAVARCPDDAPAWSTCWKLAVHCRRQSIKDRLPSPCELRAESFVFLAFSLPTESREVVLFRVHHMLDDALKFSTATTRPFA